MLGLGLGDLGFGAFCLGLILLKANSPHKRPYKWRNTPAIMLKMVGVGSQCLSSIQVCRATIGAAKMNNSDGSMFLA